MNEKQFEELIKALGRIAVALEIANHREMYPLWTLFTPEQSTYTSATSSNGWTCQSCGSWVFFGDAHACGGTTV